MRRRRSQRSLTTSRPRTRALPLSGTISVASIRNSVVLPPPSGPTKPNSSDAATENDSPLSAGVSPNRFSSRSAATAYAGGAGIARLNRRRRDLRARRDPGDRTGDDLPWTAAGVNRHPRLLAEPDRRQLRLGDVGPHLHRLQVGDAIERLAGLHHLSRFRVGGQHGAVDRVAHLGLADPLAGLTDL